MSAWDVWRAVHAVYVTDAKDVMTAHTAGRVQAVLAASVVMHVRNAADAEAVAYAPIPLRWMNAIHVTAVKSVQSVQSVSDARTARFCTDVQDVRAAAPATDATAAADAIHVQIASSAPNAVHVLAAENVLDVTHSSDATESEPAKRKSAVWSVADHVTHA